MNKRRILILSALLAMATFPPALARAQTAIPGPCDDGTLPSGAKSRICVPINGWNGQLVVFAHGYVAFNAPLDFYNLSLADGTDLSLLAQTLGFAFATTSYRQNGLAILEGIDDLDELIDKFNENHSALRIYLAGVSEGALTTTLLAERSRNRIDAALATCGPIGSFHAQLDYIYDFRVLFDYFFPGLIPGSAIDVPASVMTNWNAYRIAITGALAARPARALELMRVANSAYDPANPATIVNTTLDLLWYGVFGNADTRRKLGGNPYGNRLRWYFGSSNDLQLNLRVARFSASPRALAALRPYETSGDLRIPLVTLHTIADDVVPVWQELLYWAKARGRFVPLLAPRYGHCNFTTSELVGALQATINQP
ncbi:MAG: hypothetical protein ABI868_00180 [Acidobacteriota bacterium]